MPAIAGGALKRPGPIFWEHEANRAVREGKWKLVAKEDQPWELYDVEADRGEMKDLAGEKPDMVSAMSAKWDAWATRSNVLPLGAATMPDSADHGIGLPSARSADWIVG